MMRSLILAQTRFANGLPPKPAWEEASQTHPFLHFKKKGVWGKTFPQMGVDDSPFAKRFALKLNDPISPFEIRFESWKKP